MLVVVVTSEVNVKLWELLADFLIEQFQFFFHELVPLLMWCDTTQEEGILFVYNIYEIAPYALGITSVLVPYDTLKPLLNTDYLIIKEQL